MSESKGLLLAPKEDREFCYALKNGAKIFYRYISTAVFYNLYQTSLKDDRTREIDDKRAAERVFEWGVTRWENIFLPDADGNPMAAECTPENKALLAESLPPPIFTSLFDRIITCVPKNAEQVGGYQEVSEEPAPVPFGKPKAGRTDISRKKLKRAGSSRRG